MATIAQKEFRNNVGEVLRRAEARTPAPQTLNDDLNRFPAIVVDPFS